MSERIPSRHRRINLIKTLADMRTAILVCEGKHDSLPTQSPPLLIGEDDPIPPLPKWHPIGRLPAYFVERWNIRWPLCGEWWTR